MASTVASLLEAEGKARALFDECVRAGMIVAGKTERELSDEIAGLAESMFGVRKFWHKKIVRSGINTVQVYAANPPDLTLQEDDILFFDFGPVFEEWEADFGRTFVLGGDPRKHKLAADLARGWEQGSAWYREHPDCTSAELYAYMCGLARECGWEFGHVHCGHLVGKFPHERTEPDDRTNHLFGDNLTRLRRNGSNGEPLRWVLEAHFVDRAAGFGGFQEALLLDV